MSGTPSIRPTIAVVAVHGVADQAPRESAGAIANLLLRVTRGEQSAYTSFRELPLRIPTAPLDVDDGAGLAEPATSKLKMEERPVYLADMKGAKSRMAQHQAGRAASTTPPAPPARPADGEGSVQTEAKEEAEQPFAPDHEFMRSLLLGYRGSNEPYETIRLEGHKLEGDQPVADVHVYEMYWADLSRLGVGIFRVFGELYQLLVHVASLGRVVVEHARLEHPESRAWGMYRWMHNAAVRLLTLFVPVIGMLMLGTIGLVLPGSLPRGAGQGVAMGVLAVAAAAAAGRRMYRARSAPRTAGDGAKPRRRIPTWLWALVPFLAAGVGLLLGGVLLGTRLGSVRLGPGVMSVDQLLALEWLLVAGLVLVWLFSTYRRRRPGALLWGLVFLVPSFFVIAVTIFGQRAAAPLLHGAALSDRDWIAVVALWVFEWQYLALVACWFMLGALAVAAGVLGHLLQARVADADQRQRARRAAWTARTTLAVSGASLFILTLLIFVALHAGIGRVLAPLDAFYRPMLPYSGMDRTIPLQVMDVLQGLLMASATSGLPVLLGSLAVTMVLAVWAILPAALTEVTAPRDASPAWRNAQPGDGPKERKARWSKVADDGDRSERLGTWLSRGYPTLAGASTLLWVALFVLLPGVSLARAVMHQTGNPVGTLEWLARVSDESVRVLGTLIAASAVGLLALRGRFNVVAGGLRPALDVMLDVDNYLREHPRDGTPRARIVERYVSLLRYLSLWRDTDSVTPYCAVILVSHSQGTVITADLLGFLRREKPQGMDDLIPGLKDPRDPDETPRPGRIPLYLFTMGAPLRQLYGRAFPHLYAWVFGRPPVMGRKLEQVPPADQPPSAAAVADPRSDQGHVVDAGLALTGDEAPDPAQIGLARWVNAYRSGDYVGRELWRNEDCGCLYRRIPTPADATLADPPVLTVSEDAGRVRRELCIGGGAHTHYWDATAPAIGVEVDLLVEDALLRCASSPVQPAPDA